MLVGTASVSKNRTKYQIVSAENCHYFYSRKNHYENVSVIILFLLKTGFFYLNYYKFSIKSYVVDVCLNRLAKAILIHIHDIRFYGEILKITTFYNFDSGPRFPQFLLYVRWKSGVTFVRRYFRDVTEY